VGPYQVNCYILAHKKEGQAIIIDPGADHHKIQNLLNKHKLKPAFIINTHGHADHIGCDDKFNAPVYIHTEDAPMLNSPELNLSNFLTGSYQVASEIRKLKDGQMVLLGEIELEVMHIPGHTPGGIALLMKKPENKIVFTGDSLFRLSIGRTDFPGGDAGVLIKSIKEKLLKLPDDTVIYPGHGPSSTIGEEKKDNSFLAEYA
jgi:glyoxylase-like metal-dependent hydrolase (beta-lactamase superfamily II)